MSLAIKSGQGGARILGLRPEIVIGLTIANDDGDHAIKVVPNGPGVAEAVDALILDFDPALIAKEAGNG